MTSEKTSNTLREIIPIERPLITGGRIVDEALALWFRWHDEANGVPDWAAFQPFDHPQLLTHVSLCQRIGSRYRCILIGEIARNWLPVKIAGQFIDDVMSVSNAADLAMRFDRALEDGLPNYVEKTMSRNPSNDFVRYRAAHLPFGCSHDTHARMLTLFDFETSIN